MDKRINIVSFDVPFPANYGGVIDVYYKLYWLKQAGVKVHLHCFTYGRKPAKELDELCEKVYYYKRKTGVTSALSFLPYTVKSRLSEDLATNLLSNDYPIIFEVLHTCYLLRDERFKTRKKIFRQSNIEHEYYRELISSERNFWKRIFLKWEARRLEKFEMVLNHAQVILTVNDQDTNYFKQKYPEAETTYLPSFHASDKVDIKKGVGEYILFHGNLSVSENYEAASWLIEQVFSKLDFPVIVAGLNPPAFLKALCDKYHVSLVSNPSDKRMSELIFNAQVHVLNTNQSTGLKLKLLNVLFRGRFIVAKNHIIFGTNLKANDSFFLAEEADEFIRKINACVKLELGDRMIKHREEQIVTFDNRVNVQKLIEIVFGH